LHFSHQKRDQKASKNEFSGGELEALPVILGWSWKPSVRTWKHFGWTASISDGSNRLKDREKRKKGFADEKTDKRSGSNVMLVPDGGFQWSTSWGFLEATSSCLFMAYSVCMGFEMQ
jgi:hypothetical protein